MSADTTAAGKDAKPHARRSTRGKSAAKRASAKKATLATQPQGRVAFSGSPSAAKLTRGWSKSKGFGRYKELYLAAPHTRVEIIKGGVPAIALEDIAQLMGRPKDRLMSALGLAAATVNRRARAGKTLSLEDGERLLGMARLIGQVESMLDVSGALPAVDAAQWVGQWIEEPLPALGGRRPAEFMDTAEGQGIVSNLIERMQSGAYA